MSTFSLVWNYLKSKPLNMALNITLLSLGIAVITILLLFSSQLEQKINQNAKSIDLVVGAKGSPLQLILCNIFHIDFPTGNIKLNEAERIAHNRLVKKAIPLALGDSYQDYRIVGTTQDYATLYEAQLSQGAWWNKELEAVVGSNTASMLNLKIDDSFVSNHGLTKEGGQHEEQHFIVKGILKPTSTVLDNLILTSVESIWKVHEHVENTIDEVRSDKLESNQHDSTFTASSLVPSIAGGDSTKEITSMLIQYRSPMGAVMMPRLVNSQSNMQAASPAFETARLFTILGVGVEIVLGFAYVLIFISALSIFIALYNSLKERKYDLAIMRTMGASRSNLFVTIVLEGSTLTLLGSIAGLFMGHGTLLLLAALIDDVQKAGVNGFVFYITEWWILGGSLTLGFICSLLPAIQAYRTDISRVLAEN